MRRSGRVVLLALLLVFASASIAQAMPDRYGAGAFSMPFAPFTVEESEPYAPYTAGPVVRETKPTSEPYAPYTAGPVVRETKPATEPYAPYTAGPVVRETELKETEPYAPYTAGPVVREETESPDRIRQHYKY